MDIGTSEVPFKPYDPINMKQIISRMLLNSEINCRGKKGNVHGALRVFDIYGLSAQQSNKMA